MLADDSEEKSNEMPKWGTERYKRQVETICKQFLTSALEEAHLAQFLMMFILDMSYNRAAICEAEKKIRKEKGWD